MFTKTLLAFVVCTITVLLLAVGAKSAAAVENWDHDKFLFGHEQKNLRGGGAVCPGTPNKIPVYSKKPEFVRAVPNGKLFIAGNRSNATQDWFYVIHVWGTPTQQGTAYGNLLKKEVIQQISNFDGYIENMVTKVLPWLPRWIADLVVVYGAGYLLELTYNLTAPYTHPRYIQEIDAISAAVGINKWKLRSISQFPEAIKAACTIVGANKKATQDGVCAGGIAHLRGLDFGVHPLIKRLPAVTVYHEEGLPTQANFGWIGFTGALTAMSNKLSLGEKVWLKAPIWDGSLKGEAWTFVNRDVLRETNMVGAVRTIDKAKRTCGIHLGIGSRTENKFLTFRVDAKLVEINDAKNQSHYAEHPYLVDIAYLDKYSQPTHSYCLETLLKKGYGKIDAEFLATTVACSLQTGDIHSASFDDENLVAYFANARKFPTLEGSDYAYARQWTRLDMKTIFNEQRP